MKKILLVIVLLCLSTGLMAKDKDCLDKRLLVVSASDYVEALPDTAYFKIEVSVEKDTPEEAGRIGEELRKNILRVLENSGIKKDDLLLDSASVIDRYVYDEKQEKHVYVYTARVRLKDFSKITELRQELLNVDTFEPVKDSWFSKRGLNVDTSVVYEIVDNKELLEQAALTKAYKEALQKLAVLAKVSNLEYKIYRVIEGGQISSSARSVKGYAAADMLYEAAPMKQERAAAPQTVPTTQRITSQVVVQAEII
ncbi:SIMPL domain-containing protein [Candidatus Margulisiibacteriota bacterium]